MVGVIGQSCDLRGGTAVENKDDDYSRLANCELGRVRGGALVHGETGDPARARTVWPFSLAR